MEPESLEISTRFRWKYGKELRVRSGRLPGITAVRGKMTQEAKPWGRGLKTRSGPWGSEVHSTHEGLSRDESPKCSRHGKGPSVLNATGESTRSYYSRGSLSSKEVATPEETGCNSLGARRGQQRERWAGQAHPHCLKDIWPSVTRILKKEERSSAAQKRPRWGRSLYFRLIRHQPKGDLYANTDWVTFHLPPSAQMQVMREFSSLAVFWFSTVRWGHEAMR